MDTALARPRKRSNQRLIICTLTKLKPPIAVPRNSVNATPRLHGPCAHATTAQAAPSARTTKPMALRGP